MKPKVCFWAAAGCRLGAIVTVAARQLLAAYLAVCLALAGLVGISPALHVLVEHGGNGPSHVHRAELQQSARKTSGTLHEHGESGHTHSHPPAPEPDTHLFVHSSGALPRVDVLASTFWHHVHEWLRHRDSASSQQSAGDHHHDSLASLLVSGLIDGASTDVDSVVYLHAREFCVAPLVTIPRGCDWDAQSAPRGPPSPAV